MDQITAVGTESTAATSTTDRQVRRLQERLTACPTDVLARCELASVLEELGHLEKAAMNWEQVLARDTNNLKAWEGLARCRNHSALPASSHPRIPPVGTESGGTATRADQTAAQGKE